MKVNIKNKLKKWFREIVNGEKNVPKEITTKMISSYAIKRALSNAIAYITSVIGFLEFFSLEFFSIYSLKCDVGISCFAITTFLVWWLSKTLWKKYFFEVIEIFLNTNNLEKINVKINKKYYEVSKNSNKTKVLIKEENINSHNKSIIVLKL